MNFTIECDREEDGRWFAEVPELPGVLAYGASSDEAMARAQVLALRVLAERLEHGETRPQPITISVATVRASGRPPRLVASLRPFSASGGNSTAIGLAV